MAGLVFNPAPGWPKQPEGWVPPPGWQPDPAWPAAPDGWSFWKPSPTTQTPASHATAPASHATAPERVVQPSPVSSNPFIKPDGGPPDAQAGVPKDADKPASTNDIYERASEDSSSVAHDPGDVVGRESELTFDAANSATQEEEVGGLVREVERLRAELVELTDSVLLQQVGIYQYHHPAENSEQYRVILHELQEEVKQSIRAGAAIEASNLFAYNNSLAQGRKMTKDFSRLMLRAYNAEADNCVRSVRAASVDSSKARLNRAAESIAKLGSMMDMQVTPRYHDIRLREIELTGDYMIKKQEEREKAKEERERLREEKRAELELQAERERLDKEREHYQNSLSVLHSQGRADEADALRERITAIDEAIAANDYRIANIRAGYVYVISNIGAFGPGVVKIGLTRRLDPLDRVRELGGAGVPFPFDVHAIYFSDDAVELENQLHQTFSERRVNHINRRREFFFVAPEEVRAVLTSKVGNLLDFQESPDAQQYHQSLHYWPARDENGDSLKTRGLPKQRS